MTQKKTIRKRNILTEDRIEKWTDEEVLNNFFALLGRVSIATDYVTEEIEDNTIITHEILVAVCGDKALYSEPRPLSWPLQMMPIPETLKNLAN